MKAECVLVCDPRSCIRPFTVAGAAQVKNRGGSGRVEPGPDGFDFLLLPVELQCVNHTASTNRRDSTRLELRPGRTPTMWVAMSNPIQIEQITERVERLLLRYEELQRTNALLVDQVSVLTHERDSLQSRLSAARSRVEALLERLPDSNANSAINAQPAKTSAGTGR